MFFQSYTELGGGSGRVSTARQIASGACRRGNLFAVHMAGAPATEETAVMVDKINATDDASGWQNATAY